MVAFVVVVVVVVVILVVNVVQVVDPKQIERKKMTKHDFKKHKQAL